MGREGARVLTLFIGQTEAIAEKMVLSADSLLSQAGLDLPLYTQNRTSTLEMKNVTTYDNTNQSNPQNC